MPPVPPVPPVDPLGRLGSEGSVMPPPEPPELPPLLPLPLPDPEPLPVGSGTGTFGTGMVIPPPLLDPLPEPDFAGAVGTTEPTVFWMHLPVLLSCCPAGHTVGRAADAAAVKPPPRASARAPAVTTPARRTVVLGDMRLSLRNVWGVV
jgi:hypothetical protein